MVILKNQAHSPIPLYIKVGSLDTNNDTYHSGEINWLLSNKRSSGVSIRRALEASSKGGIRVDKNYFILAPIWKTDYSTKSPFKSECVEALGELSLKETLNKHWSTLNRFYTEVGFDSRENYFDVLLDLRLICLKLIFEKGLNS